MAHRMDRKTLDPYYTQRGIAGRQEAFAESFANFHSRNYSYRHAHPNLWGYWEGRGR